MKIALLIILLIPLGIPRNVVAKIYPVPKKRALMEAIFDDYKLCCGNKKYSIICKKRNLRCFKKLPTGWSWVLGGHCAKYINGCYMNAALSKCCT